MICDVIATGSTGNAVLLNGCYLFDCGVPYSKLSHVVKKLRLVFLTHCHSDHFCPQTIHKIHKLRPAVYFVCGRNLLVPLCTEAGVSPDNVILVDPGAVTEVNFGPEQIKIQCFDLVHDVENIGYVVQTAGEIAGTAMYATDTQYLPIMAPGLDLYMVESNYRTAELQQRKAAKLAAGLFSYEDRVVVTHMSEETVKAWLSHNQRPDSQVVFLHQHVERGPAACPESKTAIT